MKDEEIINLYWNRQEKAIYETNKNMEDIVIQFHLTYCKIMKKLKNVLMIHT